VEVDYLVAEGDWAVSDADNVRRLLMERLREPGRTLWITVGLHTDPRWDAV
jgi:predicted Co/Zn/Cd cation transporter (cation efflux family)